MIFEAIPTTAGGKMKKLMSKWSQIFFFFNELDRRAWDKQLAAVAASSQDVEIPQDVMKIPVDPPGAILGACPLIHYSNISTRNSFLTPSMVMVVVTYTVEED